MDGLLSTAEVSGRNGILFEQISFRSHGVGEVCVLLGKFSWQCFRNGFELFQNATMDISMNCTRVDLFHRSNFKSFVQMRTILQLGFAIGPELILG